MTCVRVYENGTYMYGEVPVCLSVVAVPTPSEAVKLLCCSGIRLDGCVGCNACPIN